MNSAFPYPLYLVLSQADCGPRHYLDVAEQALLGGVNLIQLREKNLDTRQLTPRALALKQLTDQFDCPLIINDNLEVAMRIQAHGIHVGQSDVSPVQIRKTWPECRILGYSIESLEQLQQPDALLADYLAASPIFATPTKTDTKITWGLDGLSAIKARTDKPLIAIGGISHQHIAALIQAGADSIAVVAAICASEQPQNAARLLHLELNKYV